MRRAITAAVVSVLVLGGAAVTPAFAAEHGATKQQGTGEAQPAARAKATVGKSRSSRPKPNHAKTNKTKTDTRKTIIYYGYEFSVPAGWPVYRLDQHPTACVRYDINAVYLGTPGANTKCPAALIGRGDTISVIPGTTVAAGSGSEITYQAAQPDAVHGTRALWLKAVHATVRKNKAEKVLRVALTAAAASATVLGTYGSDPAVVEHVLASLRIAPKHAKATAQSGSLAALSAPDQTRRPAAGQSSTAAIVTARSKATGLPLSTGGRPRSGRAPSADTSKGWPGMPRDWPIQIVPGPPTPGPAERAVYGFDTCAAPSLTTMSLWRSEYLAIGVYIGGVNRSCGWGNLSAAWFKSAAAMGWGMLPTYVGLQAPCTSALNTATIDPTQAVAEGDHAAVSAIADAQIFGLGAGTPIYYDMEAYVGDASCHATVLEFLSAYDRTLAAAGYKTGVYSSEDSAIADMQAATIAKTPGFTAPDAVWVAKWDTVASLSNSSLGDLAWPIDERAKQYNGGVDQTIGGAELNIDVDLIDSPLAR